MTTLVVPVLLALASALAVTGLVTRKATRALAVSSLALLLLALLHGWVSSAHEGVDRVSAVLAAVLAIAGGGLVTTQVFAMVEDPERVRDAGAVLRGGAWIGALERLGVYVALVAGWAPGLAVVLAVKGLGRYPELRNQADTGVAERFIIGTFTSVLWAVACAGAALLAP